MSNQMGTIAANDDVDVIVGVRPGAKVIVEFFGDTADFDSGSFQVKQHRPNLDDGTDWTLVGTAFTAAGSLVFIFTGDPAQGVRITSSSIASAANVDYRACVADAI